MRWTFLIIGLLVLAIGLQEQLLRWGVTVKVIDVLGKIPMFGLSNWIFVAVGIVIVYLAFKR